jgi:hypothetical protein
MINRIAVTWRHWLRTAKCAFRLNASTVILLLSLLTGAGCVPDPVASPSPTSTSRPTGTPTHTPSPTSTDTPIPTATPTLTPTSPPTPTAALTSTPTATPDLPTATPAPTLPPSPVPPTDTPAPPTAAPLPFAPAPPPGRAFGTLDDFWAGAAEWALESPDVGLPVGESDTVYRGGSEFWSYLHASHQSAGVVDQCGDPAPFPGCVTLWKSHDGGLHFALENPVCLFPCATCPCDPGRDHTQQQQYPRVFFDTDRAYMVYEWGAGTLMRTSADGINWSAEAHVPGTGQWDADPGTCAEAESIGEHPNIYAETEFGNCLVGAPPGVYVEGGLLYVFVGLGRDPGHMGCTVGNKYAGAGALRKCASNPLFGAELGYGPVEALGAAANPYFEFRTISSADVVRVGDHYYMAYEGVRGPSNPTVVDDQFGLGFARSVGPAIDGPWEKYPGNPVIMDLANNWGIGHADIVLVGPATYLYTATSPTTRGRYVLVRR